jgi:hypothetical protein
MSNDLGDIIGWREPALPAPPFLGQASEGAAEAPADD